jgi:hypothetical protein
MDPASALASAEKALSLDPTFVKALKTKGNAHFAMTEYKKVLI